jgi:toxin ParE1/3/4
MKPVKWRAQARGDTSEAADWYGTNGDKAIELAFVAAVEAAQALIAAHPAVGSIRHADVISNLPAPLRFVRLERFERYLIYYLDLPTHVEVLRIWNTARGLDALATDDNDPTP